MQIYDIGSLALSIALLTICITLVFSRFSISMILCVAFTCLLLSNIRDAPAAVRLHALLTCGVLLVFRQTQLSPSPSRLIPFLVASAVSSFGIFAALEYPVFLRLEKWRAKYPLVSVADRLAYETKNGVTTVAPQLVLSVDLELNRIEQELARSSHGSNRISLLERLHEKTTYEFMGAPGFGNRRMYPLGKDLLREELRDHPELLQVPSVPIIPLSSDPLHSTLSAPSYRELTLPKDMDKLHEESLKDLFLEQNIGYIKERQVVAGFQPHHFTKIPESPLTLVRLELVSLLKHSEPKVYVSGNLPEMGNLDDVNTRPLDDFEAKSLQQLRRDKDLEIQVDEHRVKMLGSLRATRLCLKCHTVPRGELLGALSYELILSETGNRNESP